MPLPSSPHMLLFSLVSHFEKNGQSRVKMLERLSNALAVPLSAFFQGLGTGMTARRESGEAGSESLNPERERLLLYLVHTVHNDDIPLLIEMVRILNKRRKAQGTGKGETGRNR
jgi:hypothetical protein